MCEWCSRNYLDTKSRLRIGQVTKMIIPVIFTRFWCGERWTCFTMCFKHINWKETLSVSLQEYSKLQSEWRAQAFGLGKYFLYIRKNQGHTVIFVSAHILERIGTGQRWSTTTWFHIQWLKACGCLPQRNQVRRCSHRLQNSGVSVSCLMSAVGDCVETLLTSG